MAVKAIVYSRTRDALDRATRRGEVTRHQAAHVLGLLMADAPRALAWREKECLCPFESNRAAERTLRDRLARARKLASDLAAELEGGDISDSFFLAVLRAVKATEEQFDAHVFWPRTAEGTTDPVAALAFLLREMEKKIPSHPKYVFGGQAHHFIYGPFHLPKAIMEGQRSRLPEWDTAVLFGACMAARIATGSPRARNGTPRGGKPLRPVAAAFLADLYRSARLPDGKRLSPEQVEKRIERLEREGFGWRGWRSLQTDLETGRLFLG